MRTPAISLLLLLLVGLWTLSTNSCNKDDDVDPIPSPVITEFSPASGLVGKTVTIYGNHFTPTVPEDQGTGPHANTSIVKINGVVAEAMFVYQDDIDRQRINAEVPEGASSGKITITANGMTTQSTEDFLVTIPIYLPNVTVSTAISGVGADLARDNDGNFYLTENHYFRIVKRSPDGSETVLLSTADEPARPLPLGIALDKHNNIYATVGMAIRKITPDGTVSLLAGGEEWGFADGQGSDARFNFPWGLEVDDIGNVYVADMLNCRIRKVTPDGWVTTIAGGDCDFENESSDPTKLVGPMDVTMDNYGNLIVAHRGISKITPDGMVHALTGNIIGYYDGPAQEAHFNRPRSVEVDANDNIYFTDSDNFVVRRLGSDGNVTTVAGSTPGNIDGTGENAKFGQTLGMIMDDEGALYLTQGGGLNGIRKIVIN
ncbi:MAG: IPT/TIG domain-containing protein [Bacteroidia bacterium]|nr:IPT/TIG domain-containing protein [Bacteroidia bacterium]